MAGVDRGCLCSVAKMRVGSSCGCGDSGSGSGGGGKMRWLAKGVVMIQWEDKAVTVMVQMTINFVGRQIWCERNMIWVWGL